MTLGHMILGVRLYKWGLFLCSGFVFCCNAVGVYTALICCTILLLEIKPFPDKKLLFLSIRGCF